jgi:protease-4
VHPGKIVSTSQEVEVQVLEVDPVKRRISLGLKQTLQNPWEAFAEKHPIGSTVEGEVKNKTEFGLFIGLDGDVDGMVHLSDLDWNRPGEQVIEEFKKGDMVKAKVLDVDVEKERISLGIKQLAGDPFAEARARPIRKGVVVTCEVIEVKEGGSTSRSPAPTSPPSSSAPSWRATAPTSAPSASPSARRSTPASPCSTARPARCRCRSRRWKWPKRRKPSPSTARPTRAPRSATFSARPSRRARIESPGGTTTGAERLYGELRRVAEKKPVVAVVGTMAASGGYIAAMSADRIMARGNSLVGSIGVLFQYPNFASLLDKVGVKMEAVKSSPLKAAPSGYEPTSPEARAALNALVVDSYDWFKDMVKERRGMTDAELAAVTDGRVFTGRQGLPLKLVDAIGGEREAIEWLEKEKGVARKLPVRDWKKGRSIERLGLLGASGEIARFLGLNGLADALQRGATAQEAQLLDGLLAIWQVEAAQ